MLPLFLRFMIVGRPNTATRRPARIITKPQRRSFLLSLTYCPSKKRAVSSMRSLWTLECDCFMSTYTLRRERGRDDMTSRRGEGCSAKTRAVIRIHSSPRAFPRTSASGLGLSVLPHLSRESKKINIMLDFSWLGSSMFLRPTFAPRPRDRSRCFVESTSQASILRRECHNGTHFSLKSGKLKILSAWKDECVNASQIVQPSSRHDRGGYSFQSEMPAHQWPSPNVGCSISKRKSMLV